MTLQIKIIYQNSFIDYKWSEEMNIQCKHIVFYKQACNYNSHISRLATAYQQKEPNNL